MNKLIKELLSHLSPHTIELLILDLREAVNKKWDYVELTPSDDLIALFKGLEEYWDNNV